MKTQNSFSWIIKALLLKIIGNKKITRKKAIFAAISRNINCKAHLLAKSYIQAVIKVSMLTLDVIHTFSNESPPNKTKKKKKDINPFSVTNYRIKRA